MRGRREINQDQARPKTTPSARQENQTLYLKHNRGKKVHHFDPKHINCGQGKSFDQPSEWLENRHAFRTRAWEASQHSLVMGTTANHSSMLGNHRRA